MLTETTPCDPTILRQLLNGQLSESTEAALTTHVETCVRCRTELEQLAASTHWWLETHEFLSDKLDSVSGLSPDSASGSQSKHVPRSIADAPDCQTLTFLAPSDNPAMLGRLGEFEVLEFIGRGGMGLVLKGYDHELNRFVAIKVLRPHYAEHAAARQRFSREAQAAAAVVHPHVVAIHAVDSAHQPPYFVMSYVPGESLQQRLDRAGPLDIAEVLRISQQVAEGLAAAHGQGLIHRDIKPANILLERNVERVLLTDFGLARAVDDASLTQSGVITGTPQYMSPEQARGESLDPRTDLFSLGSVMYAMLAGHPPFRADSAYAVLRRINEDIPRPLREINPNVPDWLEAFVNCLLKKRPEDRWQSAKQVADLLKQCLAHVRQPVLGGLPAEITSLNPVRRSVLKNRMIVGAILGMVAVLSLVGVLVNRRPIIQRPIIQQGENRPSDQSDQELRASESNQPQRTHPETESDEKWVDPFTAEVERVDARLRILELETDF